MRRVLLGLAIARQLVGAGYHVIAVARRNSKGATATSTEAESNGRGALDFVPFDLSKIDEIPDFVRRLRREFGPLFGLVNNAALGLDGALAMMHNSKIEELVRMNALSPILLTKYVARAMMSDGAPGRIVNVASIVAFTGYSGLSVYAATKSSIIGFTRSLAREVGPFGISVNAVAPGFLDAEMTHALTEAQRQQVMRRSSLNRLAEVENVASAVMRFPAPAVPRPGA
jgi:3-oxoacyl-[acyl-carrier protein] reductase